MNIFVLDNDFENCARYHCDKHVVKMILEYAQLMSTAHRLLDGTLSIEIKNSRKIKRYKLAHPDMNAKLYNATHINHPSAVWVRESHWNYFWLYNLWYALCREYSIRYNKIHKCQSLEDYLIGYPTNIPISSGTDIPLCMPDEYKVDGDPIESYRRYYIEGKSNIAKWKYCETPYWYTQEVAA